MSVLQGTVYVAQLVADSDLSAATVTATVTAPNGAVSSPAVSKTGNIASANIAASLVGVYLVVWGTTGSVVGGVQDQFTVVPALASLISLSDLKDELSIAAGNTTQDKKLMRWLPAASEVVENVTGPIRPRPQTDYFDGGTGQLILVERWVSSITSVTELNGAVVFPIVEQVPGQPRTSYGYTWDRTANILTRRDASGYQSTWAGGVQSVTVTYVLGLATIPDSIQLATAELIKHWYRKTLSARQTGGFGQSGNPDMGGDMVGNYMIPNSVMEMLDQWRRPPEIS